MQGEETITNTYRKTRVVTSGERGHFGVSYFGWEKEGTRGTIDELKNRDF